MQFKCLFFILLLLPFFLSLLFGVCKFSCCNISSCACACACVCAFSGLPLGLVGPIGRGYVFVCGLPLVCVPISNCWCGSPVCALIALVLTPSSC